MYNYINNNNVDLYIQLNVNYNFILYIIFNVIYVDKLFIKEYLMIYSFLKVIY